MKVTEQDVSYVAELANLELTAGERARMAQDMNSILDYMDVLNRLDTTAVEPMAQTSDRYGVPPRHAQNRRRSGTPVDQAKPGRARFAYALREDEVGGLRPSFSNGEGLKNAPARDGSYFKVPKVIER